MTSKILYSETLPIINDTDKFIILDKAENTLEADWLSYIELIQEKAFNEKDDSFKYIKDTLKERKSVLEMSAKARNLLGIGTEFTVVSIEFLDGKLSSKASKTYEDLVDIYYAKKSEKVNGSIIRSIVDRFFAYLWSKGKLLYPISHRPRNYQRPNNWRDLISDVDIIQIIEKKFGSKDEMTKGKDYRKSFVNGVISSTTWTTLDSIKENDLTLLENTLRQAKGVTERSKEFYIMVFNDIRYALIGEGREDIKAPRVLAVEKRLRCTQEEYSKKKFEWIDLKSFPNLKEVKEFAVGYIERLKLDGLAKQTISTNASQVNGLIRYLMEYYPDSDINISLVNEIFDPSNDNSLLNHLVKNRKTKNGALSDLHIMIKFLVHAELYSEKARKNTPRNRGVGIEKQPYRSAMSKEMVMHMIDIIIHRPPNTTTKWDKSRANIDWWQHNVYPVYPMMMLFGYYIPVRGAQVRNLCRDISFVPDYTEERIETIVINTDKNVNRKYLQEIPCVWDDLQVFIPFLKWHKEYYKNIKKVKYENDPNTVWEDFSPLMCLPNTQTPMSKGTHLIYHKKLLCQYQIEQMEKAKERGEETYPIVAWNKTGKPFFKTVEEISNANANIMKDIGVMYDIHSLRVTGATRYLEGGLGIKMVMELTGHINPNTLMRIYINLTRAEKVTKLKSAVDKIFFGKEEDLISNTSDLIKGELTDAYNNGKESLAASLENNGLFSLHRKATMDSEYKELHQGVEIIINQHPTSWFPMIHGICPAVKCPEGRQHKCSLCPYLVTGRLFINGVVLQANQAIADFQREAVELEEELSRGYQNQSRSEGLEMKLEEVLGWWDIMQKIQDELSLNTEETTELSESKHMVKKDNVASQVFGMETIETELGYLKNAYYAEAIGVGHDRFGLKVLTIKAMKIAVQNKDINKVEEISNNETKAIDYLMGHYTGEATNNGNIEDFIDSIGVLSDKTSK